jgi:hypothetical protein
MVETDQRWRYCYSVQVPTPGADNWYELVVALTPEHASEVIRVLLACGGSDPYQVRVVKRPLD